VAAQLVTWEKGMNQHTASKGDGQGEGSANLQTRQAARALSISERAVAAMRAIRREGSASLVDAIRDGRVNLHQGEALKMLPDTEVQRLLKAGDRAVMETAKALRTEKMKAARENRLSLMSAISAKGIERAAPGTLPKRAFGVIYADVPWEQLGDWSDETGKDRAYPYPTMPLDDIKALCAGDESPALDDAVLYFWRTANRLRPALEVIEAWGFEAITEIVWDKVDIGMGRWVRDRHEVLVIAKRGAPPCPLPGTQIDSVQTEKKTWHSAKPDFARAMIDVQFPGVAKLELFGRGDAPDGWTFWGFEAGCSVLTLSPGEGPAALRTGPRKGSDGRLPLPPSAGVDADGAGDLETGEARKGKRPPRVVARAPRDAEGAQTEGAAPAGETGGAAREAKPLEVKP
jgi:N6-adenosine-specific RNA methylase IME4